jgi:pimeloyl-ACP methyl ester carboxylesterase
MSWQAVARHMPPDWTLAAPDLRGRGHSRDLPGPYGLDRHARDVVAVLRHFGGRPVLAGHSMGAYVALLARDARPELVRRLVLVDGGLPLPVPDGADLDAVLDATLGPAIERLGQTFPSTEAYLDFWRAHPALAAHWTPDVEAYARYDLIGEPGQLRSRVVGDAVRTDGGDVLAEKPFTDALQRLSRPTPLLTATTGMFGAPPPLIPHDVVEAWQGRVPALRPQVVPDVNHYTIMFDREGAAAVSQAIRAAAL